MRPATTGPAPEAGAPATVRSPLFMRVLGMLESRERPVVIDLGSATPELLDRLGPMHARLEVIDLPRALEAWHEPPDAEQPGQHFIDWLLPPGPRPADVVLAWDLPNYLPLPVFGRLMHEVARRCRRGALLHMLATYAHSRMPARPGRYVPEGYDALRCAPANAALIDAPRHSSEAIDAALQGMHMERAVLLRSGLQEMLFEVE